jgi:hypothetical protein
MPPLGRCCCKSLFGVTNHEAAATAAPFAVKVALLTHNQLLAPFGHADGIWDRPELLALLRHADCIKRCLFLSVTQKTFAQAEFFSV